MKQFRQAMPLPTMEEPTVSKPLTVARSSWLPSRASSKSPSLFPTAALSHWAAINRLRFEEPLSRANAPTSALLIPDGCTEPQRNADQVRLRATETSGLLGR